MSRSREYQQILNSKAWQQLRISYLRAHPYCERCLAEGRYVSPVDVPSSCTRSARPTGAGSGLNAYEQDRRKVLILVCKITLTPPFFMGKENLPNLHSLS